MPNCRVAKGMRILINEGQRWFGGEELVIREVVTPIGGEDRGCVLVNAGRPGKGFLDSAYFKRSMYTVVSPRKPEGCRP